MAEEQKIGITSHMEIIHSPQTKSEEVIYCGQECERNFNLAKMVYWVQHGVTLHKVKGMQNIQRLIKEKAIKQCEIGDHKIIQLALKQLKESSHSELILESVKTISAIANFSRKSCYSLLKYNVVSAFFNKLFECQSLNIVKQVLLSTLNLLNNSKCISLLIKSGLLDFVATSMRDVVDRRYQELCCDIFLIVLKRKPNLNFKIIASWLQNMCDSIRNDLITNQNIVNRFFFFLRRKAKKACYFQMINNSGVIFSAIQHMQNEKTHQSSFSIIKRVGKYSFSLLKQKQISLIAEAFQHVLSSSSNPRFRLRVCKQLSQSISSNSKTEFAQYILNHTIMNVLLFLLERDSLQIKKEIVNIFMVFWDQSDDQHDFIHLNLKLILTAFISILMCPGNQDQLIKEIMQTLTIEIMSSRGQQFKFLIDTLKAVEGVPVIAKLQRHPNKSISDCSELMLDYINRSDQYLNQDDQSQDDELQDDDEEAEDFDSFE